MSPAKEATYLVSKEIKSPMGANLTGFASKEEALNTQNKRGGEIYTWNELLIKFDAE
jgi:copper chaperone NosL